MNQILLVKELNFVKDIKLSVWSDKTQMELFCVFFSFWCLNLYIQQWFWNIQLYQGTGISFEQTWF